MRGHDRTACCTQSDAPPGFDHLQAKIQTESSTVQRLMTEYSKQAPPCASCTMGIQAPPCASPPPSYPHDVMPHATSMHCRHPVTPFTPGGGRPGGGHRGQTRCPRRPRGSIGAGTGAGMGAVLLPSMRVVSHKNACLTSACDLQAAVKALEAAQQSDSRWLRDRHGAMGMGRGAWGMGRGMVMAFCTRWQQ